jgi:hypothetical protein
LPPGTHRLLVVPTPDIEVPAIYAIGKVSTAACLREKWVEVRSSAAQKNYRMRLSGFRPVDWPSSILWLAVNFLLRATGELLLVCLASLLGLVISLHVDR